MQDVSENSRVVSRVPKVTGFPRLVWLIERDKDREGVFVFIVLQKLLLRFEGSYYHVFGGSEPCSDVGRSKGHLVGNGILLHTHISRRTQPRPLWRQKAR